MTTALLILAGLIGPFLASYAVARILGAFIDAGMHPRRGEGEEQGSGDVDAELDGGRLPAGMIGNFHSRSTKINLEQDHG